MPQRFPHTEDCCGGGGGGYWGGLVCVPPQQKQESPEHPIALVPRYTPPTLEHSLRASDVFPVMQRPYVMEASEFFTPHREPVIHWGETSGEGGEMVGGEGGEGDVSGGGGGDGDVSGGLGGDPPQQWQDPSSPQPSASEPAGRRPFSTQIFELLPSTHDPNP